MADFTIGSRPAGGQAEPIKVPKEIQSPIDASKTDIAPPMITAQRMVENSRKNDLPLPRLIPLQAGEDDFVAPAFVRVGTSENVQAYANITGDHNPEGKRIANKAQWALKDREAYEKSVSQYKDTMSVSQSLSGLGGGGSLQGLGGVTAGTTGDLSSFIKGKDAEIPKMHPLTAWMTSFGKTDVEIVSGIAKAQLRAEHYAKRYIADGVGKFFDSSDNLLGAPDALFDHMKAQGMFRTKEEEEFFKAGYSNKFSQQYETSPFHMIQRAYMNKWKGTAHPSQLKDNIEQYGFRLNPKNPEHKQMFRDFLAWEDEHPGIEPAFSRYTNNFRSTIGSLFDAVTKSVYTSVSSVGNPEVAWSDDFKDEDAKYKLEQKLLKLASAKHNGEILEGFTEDSAMDMVTKKYVKDGKIDMDMVAGDRTQGIPQIIVEISKDVKELDEKGAFKKDIRGVTSILTFASAAVTGTIGMAMMGVNSDPRSTTMRLNNSVTALSRYMLDDDTDKVQKSLAEIYEEQQMEGMNTGADYARWHHHLSQEGIFGSRVIDSRWHGEGSMFLTAFEGYAVFSQIGKAGASLVGRTSAGKNFLERVGLQDSLDATLSQVNTLARQGVKLGPDVLPPDVRQMVIGIQKDAIAVGEKIDIYEAIKRAFEGKGKMIDPKNPSKLVAASEDMLNRLGNAIGDKAKQTASMRDAIATAANEGKKIVYSKDAYDMIERARKRLQELHPETDFSKLPDSTIYDRLRRGTTITDINGKPVISPNEMNKLSLEIGRSWKGIRGKDIAGYVGGAQLPVTFNFVYDNPLAKGVNAFFKAIGTGSEWLDNLEKTYGSPRSGITAAFKVTGSSGVTVSTLQTTNPGPLRWAMLNSIIPLSRFIGGIGRQLEILQEYGVKASMVGNDFDSAMLGVRADVHAEMRKLLIQRASLTRGEWPAIKEQLKGLGENIVKEEPDLVSGSVNVEKEIKAIDMRLDYLEAKSAHVKRLHALGADGAVAGTFRLFKDGTVSVATNELLLGLTDNFAGIGGGTAYAGFGSSVNTITSGWTSHWNKDNNLRIRTNQDLAQIRGYMDSLRNDTVGDVQRMKIWKVMIQARDDADAIGRKQGQNVGDTHFAKQMFTLAQVFRTNAKLELTNAGTRNGLVSLMEHLQYQDPEFADTVKKQYLDTASKMGLNSREAEAYANQMIEGMILSNAGKTRVGTIEKQTDLLKAKIQKISDNTLGELNVLEAGAKILAAEAGINVEELFPSGFKSEIVDVLGPKTMENPYGVPIETQTTTKEVKTNIDSIDTSKMSPDVVKKIQAFQEEFVRIKNLQLEAHKQISEHQSEIHSLELERVDIGARQDVTQFRDGQIITSPIDGSFITSQKNGITIWDRNGEVTIFLDQDKFSTSVGREEIAHALFYHKNMADSRAALKNMILGEWGVDDTGKAVMKHGPKIAKTVEGSLALMDMFVKAHSETLSESDAVMFRASWELGKKNYARNQNDTRLMQQVFLEFSAKLYQARLEYANPHFGRTDAMGSSPQGSFEGGTVTNRVKQGFEKGDKEGLWAKGWSSSKFLSKLVMGALTIEDIVNDGNPINTSDIDFNGKNPAAKYGLKEKIVDASMFLASFGRNGSLEQMWKDMTQDKLTDMGFVLSGNESNDPQKFYQYGTFRHPITGEQIQIGKHEWEWASQMIAHTRNRGTKTETDALWDLDTIEREKSDTSEEANKRRWQWALSTGREKFINPETMQFKKSLDALMTEEWAPVHAIVQRVVAMSPEDAKGEFGLTVKKTLDGKTVLIGAPNYQQTKKIIEHIKANYGKGSGANEITMKNIVTLLNAIADGNFRDSKATPDAKGGAPGWTQVFLAEYAGVTHRSEIGTTKRVVVNGEEPRLRLLVPLRVIIRDSSLDVKGKKKGEAEGDEPTRLAEMYVQMWSPWKANMAKLNAWNGLYFDADGNQPISKKLIQDLFKTRKNLDTAMDLILTNYQQGGSVDRISEGKLSEAPPHHSWEVLLPMAGGNPGNAKKMANIMNRIMGFEQTQFVELNGLEQLAIQQKGKLTAAQDERRDALREKFDPENEGEGAISEDSISAREKRQAILYGRNPNPLGRNPMRDAQHPLSEYRIDRFGEIQPHQDAEGKNQFVKWNQFTEGWGNANYSSENWTPLAPDVVAKKTKEYNMAGKQLISGIVHRSGYAMYTLEDPMVHDVNDVPTREIFLIDPNHKLVGRGYKDKQSAFADAETHAQNSKLPPEKDNRIEQALVTAGWNPVGTGFAGAIRDKFVHESGKYRIERTSLRGHNGYDLIDINTGLILAEQLKAGMGLDKKTPNIDDVVEAVKWVEDNNIVQIKLTEAYEKSLKGESAGKLAEWTIVRDDAGNKEEQLFAANNPIYYDIRRRLAVDLGWKATNEITSIMRSELGDDVVANDFGKVWTWIDNWQKAWSTEQLKKMTEKEQKQAKTDVDEINRAEQELYTLRAGVELDGSLKKPKAPTAPIPEGNPAKDKSAAEVFKKQMDEYTKEALAWQEHQESLQTDFAVDDTKIANIIKYIKELQKRESEFQKISKMQGMSKAAFDAQRGQGVAEQMAFVKNSAREAGISGESIWYRNNGGYIIQQLMYKDIGNKFGIRITGKKTLVQGVDRDLVKDTNFILYSPGGQVLMRARTKEELADEVHKRQTFDEGKWLADYTKRIAAEEANKTPKGTPKGPIIPSRSSVTGPDSRYTKPAPR